MAWRGFRARHADGSAKNTQRSLAGEGGARQSIDQEAISNAVVAPTGLLATRILPPWPPRGSVAR
jgi:hypothetical protein